MTSRPILFSAPMVRALLDGRKTQTRRIVKPQPEGVINVDTPWWKFDSDPSAPNICPRCPFGQPGDQLWVRETWCHTSVDAEEGNYTPDYKATANGQPIDGKWRPSIHMPRWASRITLEITDVRVERLNDICFHDAVAEGVSGWVHDPRCETAQDGYRVLWESINGPGSWDSNPWVWALTFRRVTP